MAFFWIVVLFMGFVGAGMMSGAVDAAKVCVAKCAPWFVGGFDRDGMGFYTCHCVRQ